MRTLALFWIAAVFACPGLAATTAIPEPVVKSRLQSVGLFKNGVVVVQEEIDVPGSGKFMLENVPTPIHGTFFLESDAVVETTVTQREVEEPLDAGQTLVYQKDLAGQQVTVYFYDSDTKKPLVGKVVEVPAADPNRPAPQQNNYGNYAVMPSYRTTNPPATLGGLILDTDEGRTYLTSAAMINRIVTETPVEKVKRQRPVMIFNVKTEKAAKIRLFYLSKGISWAPSYRVDITDPKQLTIEQTAIVMNEFRELADTDISLISGFPKIECENVDSPLGPNFSLSTFFQQLSNRSQPQRNSMMTQQAVFMSNAAPILPPTLPDASAVGVAGEGPDIHLQKAGKRSMNFGDVLSLSTGKAQAEYERVVEWTVPNARDAWGRYPNSNNNPNSPISPFGEPWDMLRFRNPLDFPMTTAPATIVAGGQFFGQNASYWASPKEMTKIPITKSMSVRVHAQEQERQGDVKPGERPAEVKIVTRYGTRYREATIDVELTIVNRRAEPVKMLVMRQFYGEQEKDIDGATVRLLNENLGAMNRQHEVQWEFDLPSGETKKLNYAYAVWIAL